jgi:type III pantothenate kinase
MLLAIDVGNTNVTLGVFEKDDLRATWRIATDAAKLADEYAVTIDNLLSMSGLSRASLTQAVFASVVPSAPTASSMPWQRCVCTSHR